MTQIIEVSNQEFFLVEDQIISTLEVEECDTLVIAEEVLTLVSEAAQGPQGIQGPRGEPGASGDVSFVYQAVGAISGHRVVTLDEQGMATYASSDTAAHAHRVVGVTMNAASPGDALTIKKFGEVTEPSWSWQIDQPVYLAADGVLTQVQPTAPASKFSLVVGFPVSATTLFVSFGIPITLVA